MLNGQDYMYQTNRYYHELWLKEKGEGIYEDYMIPNDDAADFKPRYSNDQILNAPTVPWFDEITRTRTYAPAQYFYKRRNGKDKIYGFYQLPQPLRCSEK